MSAPLWEYKHPYYISESNFFARDYHADYGSWEEFVESEQPDPHNDRNLVFRWDWKTNEYVDDATAVGRRAYAARFGDHDHAFTLQLAYMLQRKGIYRCVEVSVCKADEPVVREFLVASAQLMRLIWEPLLDADGA